MWKGSIKLGYAKKVCYFPRFNNELGGGVIKIQWLVTYTWVQIYASKNLVGHKINRIRIIETMGVDDKNKIPFSWTGVKTGIFLIPLPSFQNLLDLRLIWLLKCFLNALKWYYKCIYSTKAHMNIKTVLIFKRKGKTSHMWIHLNYIFPVI